MASSRPSAVGDVNDSSHTLSVIREFSTFSIDIKCGFLCVNDNSIMIVSLIFINVLSLHFPHVVT